MADSTDIKYEKVKAGINSIRDSKSKMGNILNDFSSSMKNATAEDTFKGDASNEEQGKFTSLSSHFEEFTDLVEQFAAMVEGGATSTATTEQKLQQAAEELKNN